MSILQANRPEQARSLATSIEQAPDRKAGLQTPVASQRPASAHDDPESAAPGSGEGTAPGPLPIATVLVNALDAAGVKYGIIQDVCALPEALAGRDDIDLLVEKGDYAAFCSILDRLHGVRGTSLSCYDNVCAGREDWFLPDFAHGKYLHLDVHVGVRAGWEFRKRYLLSDRILPWRWERVAIGDASLRVAAPEAELRRAIARFAFGSWAPPWRRWVALRASDGLLARMSGQEGGSHGVEIRGFPPPPATLHRGDGKPLPGEDGQLAVDFGSDHGRNVSCRIRQGNGSVLVHRGDLRRLRQSIRCDCGLRGPGAADVAVHLARKASYVALRLLQRVAPGSMPPKRRPANGGLVVALVGPDGVGKSTQVDRLVEIFGWKFGCVRAYAGTGDGKGWWLRKQLAKPLARRREQINAAIRQNREPSSPGNWISGAFAMGQACWGLLIAFERYATVRRAHRSATRGLIVICDRWPQARQRGYLDGPIIPPGPARFPGHALLARLEQRLYREMQRMRPHLTLHLVADHAISEKRKPGGISKDAFDARLSLMAELRRLDKDIKTVDASASLETVGRELFRHVWSSL